MKKNVLISAGLLIVIGIFILIFSFKGRNGKTVEKQDGLTTQIENNGKEKESESWTEEFKKPEKALADIPEDNNQSIDHNENSETKDISEEDTKINDLRDKLELDTPDTTPSLEMMKKYSTEENALFARIQRNTNKKPPEEVKEIIKLHRKEVGYDLLTQKTKELFAGNMQVRVEILHWLNRVYKKETEPASPSQGPTIGGKVEKAD